MNHSHKLLAINFRNFLIGLFPIAFKFYSITIFILRDIPKISKNGLSAPLPRWLKDAKLVNIVKKLKPELFIETGTYLGDTIWLLKDRIKTIRSIEVEPNLALEAAKRFKKWKNISILQGDSSNIIKDLTSEIRENRALFWLDGHYSSGITGKGSKDCPIFEELSEILPNFTVDSLILIDDARCFNGESDYPTFEQVKELAEKNNCVAICDLLADHIIIRRRSLSN